MSKRINVYILVFFVLLGIGLFLWLTYIPDDQRDSIPNFDSKKELVLDPNGPRYGGVFRIVLPENLTFRGPIHIESTFQNSIVQMLYNRLCYVDTNGGVREELVHAWETDGNHSNVTLSIRKRVRFHGGEELTSKDVINSLNVYLKDRSFRTNHPSTDNTLATEVIDPYKIRFLLAKSDPEIIKRVCEWPVRIFGQSTKRDGLEIPQGTGPFIFKNHKGDKEWILEANPDYFLGRPYLDRIVYLGASDVDTVMALFYGKNIDQVRLNKKQTLTQSYVHKNSGSGEFTGSMHDVWLSHR